MSKAIYVVVAVTQDGIYSHGVSAHDTEWAATEVAMANNVYPENPYKYYVVIAVDADGGYGYLVSAHRSREEAEDVVENHNILPDDIYTYYLDEVTITPPKESP